MKPCSRWALLTNVAFADYRGARLWCKGVLIDLEPRDGLGGGQQKQVRGLSWGGISAFTLWFPGDADVRVEPHEGGRFVLVNSEVDGKDHNLDGGAVVRVNGEAVLSVNADNFRQPIRIETVDRIESGGGPPFGDEFDRLALRTMKGQAYPRTVWTQVG